MTLPVKESSDELNPAVVVPPEAVPTPRPTPQKARSALDYAALAIATFGVGYLPLIPGTFGSMVGVAIFMLLVQSVALQLLFIAVIVVLGVWAAFRTEKLLGRKDPGIVVADEVAGQMIALLPLPFLVDGPWLVWVIVSFNLFRLFDIFKPYPARRFEALPGGFGIMADDLVAGIYGAIATAILISAFG